MQLYCIHFALVSENTDLVICITPLYVSRREETSFNAFTQVFVCGFGFFFFSPRPLHPLRELLSVLALFLSDCFPLTKVIHTKC